MKEAMMRLDFTNVDLKDINNYEEKAMDAFKTLIDRSGEGNDFLGWIDRPIIMTKMSLIESKRLQQKSNLTVRF